MKFSPNPSHTVYRPATRLSTLGGDPPLLRLQEASTSTDPAAKTRNGGFGVIQYHSIDILKGYVDTSGSEFLEQARRMISTKQVPYSKVLKSKRKALRQPMLNLSFKDDRFSPQNVYGDQISG